MAPQSKPDCEFCPDHNVTENRLSALEKDRTVMEANSATGGRLTTRVSMLIALISIGTLTVLAGTVYTFTAIAQFKGEYAEHRIALINKVNTSQNKIVEKLSNKMEGMERRIDNRLDTMSTKIATMEATIDREHK